MSAPRMVYADSQGNILDHPELKLAGSAAGRWEILDEKDCIPLPEGSELFLLPHRLPVGVNSDNKFQVLTQDPMKQEETVSAVAAFMAPAHTANHNACYKTLPNAENLPLFAYTAVGFSRGQFVVSGVRTDLSPRQDPARFPPRQRIESAARRLLRTYGKNRLWQQLGICALNYGCPAALNLVLGRWEAPLPTSPVCNANCIGCISYQPDGLFPCTQDRITFTPTAQEVAEVANHHLAKARDPLVSFGQGCEGEPLMQADLLTESIRLIRAEHPAATVNLNTNGSRPEVVTRLMRAGLSSIRVSVNSLLKERHQAYYRPKGWSLDDARMSLKEVKRANGHASINLLTLPGVTDSPLEADALFELVEEVGLDLIQWRNLNIDPEVYLKMLDIKPPKNRLGIAGLIEKLKRQFPNLKHGYFNPKLF